MLLIYSADCPAHEQVVIELANFIRGEWNVTVYFDLWDQKTIADHGWHAWFKQRLTEAHHVLIVCSTGARYKFARNRPFRIKSERAVPDTFVRAVDALLERSHIAKQSNTNINCPSMCIVNFAYAGESDIPAKLDTARRFKLMQDLSELFCHVTGRGKGKTLPSSALPQAYKHSKHGKQLHQVLKKALDFFNKNPDWLGEVLEPVESDVPSDAHDSNTDSPQTTDTLLSPNSPLSPRSGGERETVVTSPDSRSSPTPAPSSSHSRVSSVANEEDSLIALRQERRKREEEQSLQRVSRKKKYLRLGGREEAGDAWRSTSIGDDIGEEEMLRDLDFIRNYDPCQPWTRADTGDVLINIDIPESVTVLPVLSADTHGKLANGFANPLFFGDAPTTFVEMKSDKNDNVIFPGINPFANTDTRL